MQKLFGDKAATADTAFLRELFLQRLPPNVRMVLASAGGSQSLEELADLADKVIYVAAPAVLKLTPYSAQMLINHVQRYQMSNRYSNPCICQNLHLTVISLSPLIVHPAQLHVKHNHPPISVSIISVLGMMPKSANLRALGQEMNRPVTNGNQCSWQP